MTGSRRHDILGKKENNLSNIRTLYRFENREELMHAEADQIVVTTTELLEFCRIMSNPLEINQNLRRNMGCL